MYSTGKLTVTHSSPYTTLLPRRELKDSARLLDLRRDLPGGEEVGEEGRATGGDGLGEGEEVLLHFYFTKSSGLTGILFMNFLVHC